MKFQEPTKTKQNNNQASNDAVDKVEMSIDEASAHHLMGTLSNLYSKPELATLREVLSNAVDANRRAGTTRRAEVWLTDNRLVVRDYGDGMDRDQIINIYSKYGASTKRVDNSQIGGFGLGAKSPLSITDTFAVTSIKNGVKLLFNVSRDEDGINTIQFVSEEETTVPSGVSVSIPYNPSKKNSPPSTQQIFGRNNRIPNVDATTLVRALAEDLDDRSFNFLSTWNPKEILWNGVNLEDTKYWEYSVYNPEVFRPIYQGTYVSGWVSKTKIPVWLSVVYYDDPNSPKWMHTTKQIISQHTIEPVQLNMAGVNYPVTSDLLPAGSEYLMKRRHTGNDYVTVLNTHVGAVDLAPSREKLTSTKRTKDAVASTLETVVVGTVAELKTELNKLPARTDVIPFIADSAPLFFPGENYPDRNGEYMGDIMYRGEKIPVTIALKTAVLQAHNTTKWKDWSTGQTLSLVSIARGIVGRPYGDPLIQNINIRPRYINQPKQLNLFIMGEDTEANRDVISKNARSYSQSLGGDKTPRVYFFDRADKPDNVWFDELITVLPVEELAEVGLAYRRKVAKEVAAKRAGTPTTPRAKAIHYGFPANTNTAPRLVSVDDFKDYKKVIVIPQKNDWGYEAGDQSSVRAMFWDTLVSYVDKPAENSLPVQLDKVISQLNDDALFVFVPKNRKTSPIIKAAGDKVYSIHSYLNERRNALGVAEKSAYDVLTGLGLFNQQPNMPYYYACLQDDYEYNSFFYMFPNSEELSHDGVRIAVEECVSKGDVFRLALLDNLWGGPTGKLTARAKMIDDNEDDPLFAGLVEFADRRNVVNDMPLIRGLNMLRVDKPHSNVEISKENRERIRRDQETLFMLVEQICTIK